jgi:hypothetical protein
MNLNRETVEHELNNLLVFYPELAEDEQLRRDMIEGATSVFEYMTFLVRRIGETRAYATGTKGYVNELKGRIDRLERAEQFYRDMIRRLMDKMDFKKLPLEIAHVRIQAGKPKVMITDEKMLPRDCLRVMVEPNKTVIAEHLKAGHVVPGAMFGNSEPHLVVTFK